MKLTINMNSCKGASNKTNEDYCSYRLYSDDCALIVLVDGIGGLSFGHIAAQLVANSIADYADLHRVDMPLGTLLKQAVIKANEEIQTECYRRKCKMGVSVAILYIQGQEAFYTGLGNVRIYANDDDNFVQLTTDHVYSPTIDRTFLHRCLNGKPIDEEPIIKSINIINTSKILLCTDGCYTNNDVEKLQKLEVDYLTSDSFEDDNSVVEVMIKN